jgi:hypothetical protein
MLPAAQAIESASFVAYALFGHMSCMLRHPDAIFCSWNIQDGWHCPPICSSSVHPLLLLHLISWHKRPVRGFSCRLKKLNNFTASCRLFLQQLLQIDCGVRLCHSISKGKQGFFCHPVAHSACMYVFEMLWSALT